MCVYIYIYTYVCMYHIYIYIYIHARTSCVYTHGRFLGGAPGECRSEGVGPGDRRDEVQPHARLMIYN